MPTIPDPIVTPVELAARLARIEERLDALETAVGQDQADIAVRKDDLDRLAWAVKHGRKRPW